MAAGRPVSSLARKALRSSPLATRYFATSATAKPHHQIVIVGGGTAGITAAAQLRRTKGAEKADIAILDPASTHFYQVSFI